MLVKGLGQKVLYFIRNLQITYWTINNIGQKLNFVGVSFFDETVQGFLNE